MRARNQEEVRRIRLGDRVIRIRRKRRLRPQLLSWRELTEVIREVVFETPFFVMVPIILVLLLLFSAGIYFIDGGPSFP